MEKNPEDYTKVLFRYHSDTLDEVVAETMWAKKIDEEKGLYQLDSIPFYGPAIATDDIFYAEFDDAEDILTYQKTMESSGNSIIQVYLLEEETIIEKIQEEFRDLSCKSEGFDEVFFSMEILATKNYAFINKKLEEYARKKILAYAEPMLSKKHTKDLK
jgi:hypothetical protein